MTNVPSHVHLPLSEDSSLFQASLVTEAQIFSHVSIRMLWVTPLSLRRFLSPGSAWATRSLTQPAPWSSRSLDIALSQSAAAPLPC